MDNQHDKSKKLSKARQICNKMERDWEVKRKGARNCPKQGGYVIKWNGIGK